MRRSRVRFLSPAPHTCIRSYMKPAPAKAFAGFLSSEAFNGQLPQTALAARLRRAPVPGHRSACETRTVCPFFVDKNGTSPKQKPNQSVGLLFSWECAVQRRLAGRTLSAQRRQHVEQQDHDQANHRHNRLHDRYRFGGFAHCHAERLFHHPEARMVGIVKEERTAADRQR